MTAPTALVLPGTLVEHLRTWVGTWPPAVPVAVAADPRRAEPAWDGRVAPVTGVVTETGAAALGLAPEVAARVAPATPLDPLLDELPDLLGTPGVVARAVYRWSVDPAPGPDAGVWLPVDDPRVPPWLHPFGGEVLVALESGAYVGGVGIKKHDRHGHELAVVTQEAARGRGIARRLVAQAARRVLDEGAIPTYLHAPSNVASARVAEAAGFADVGWGAVGFFAHPRDAAASPRR